PTPLPRLGSLGGIHSFYFYFGFDFVFWQRIHSIISHFTILDHSTFDSPFYHQQNKRKKRQI
ncbi:hypothetical protein DERF_010651, partial [Dermatophagoides farinae]